jgi:hypothetical protein
VPAATNFLERHRYIWSAARDNLLKAQAEQKKYADRHRRADTFKIGDEVLLSTRDLQLVAAPGQPRAAKLVARFVGPFRVVEVVNDNAYKLDLPPQLHIYPVQNVSKLRRYVSSPERFAGRPEPAARPPPEFTDATGGDVYEVERILAQRRGQRRRVEYLVKWKGYPNEDCSWVPVGNLDCPETLADFRARQGAPETAGS